MGAAFGPVREGALALQPTACPTLSRAKHLGCAAPSGSIYVDNDTYQQMPARFAAQYRRASLDSSSKIRVSAYHAIFISEPEQSDTWQHQNPGMGAYTVTTVPAFDEPPQSPESQIGPPAITRPSEEIAAQESPPSSSAGNGTELTHYEHQITIHEKLINDTAIQIMAGTLSTVVLAATAHISMYLIVPLGTGGCVVAGWIIRRKAKRK